MFTNCSQLIFSDYQDAVIDNLIKNIKENKTNHNHVNIDFDTVLTQIVACDQFEEPVERNITIENNSIYVGNFRKSMQK